MALGPARVLDHAVDGDELGHDDLGHLTAPRVRFPA
jgi:hypothetical protein